jgi:hypothetical protein
MVNLSLEVRSFWRLLLQDLKRENILKIVYVAFGSLQARDQQFSIRLMSKFPGNSMCKLAPNYISGYCQTCYMHAHTRPKPVGTCVPFSTFMFFFQNLISECLLLLQVEQVQEAGQRAPTGEGAPARGCGRRRCRGAGEGPMDAGKGGVHTAPASELRTLRTTPASELRAQRRTPAR